MTARKISVFLGAILFAITKVVWANSGCNLITPIVVGSTYQQGHFVLHYANDGPNAIENPDDFNQNEVPDIVENAATQLQVMHDLLLNFRFESPLTLSRYASQGAKVIHVRFIRMNGNGAAMDEPRTPKGHKCGLLINLSTRLAHGNLTPAHEYFHLIQYGYAPYKRAWYLEGMARWAETLLGKEASFPQQFNRNEAVDRKQLFAMRYDAYPAFWRAFARHGNEQHTHELPAHLRSARYVRGDAVIKDNQIHGVKKMRTVLQALKQQGIEDSKRFDVDPVHWPEQMQRDPLHDETIWNVLSSF